MNKIKWIWMLALVAGLTFSPISASADGGFTDSLHYKYVGDTAVWDEELGAYTVEFFFEMKWSVPGEKVGFMSLMVDFDTVIYSYESAKMDSSNWHKTFKEIVIANGPGIMLLEWSGGGGGPDSINSFTTGGFVRYGSFKLIIHEHSTAFEADILLVRHIGNHTTIRVIDLPSTWFLRDMNYTDGSVTFQGITETPCCNTPGDADNSGKFNIADVTQNIARIFAGGSPAPCLAEADADANATLNIADVTFMIARIFAGGPAPSCVSTII